MKLRVATCQFPVSANIERNRRYVARQMRAAKAQGARVAHFCECAMSGYAGTDLTSHAGLDWDQLEDSIRGLIDLAGELGIWVVLGSAHRLTGRRKPHNSVYVISDRGEIVDRYDKRFCSGDRAGREGDLAHYTPGDHPTIFEIDGMRCGVLVCYDFRYPELYREYKGKGVQLVFHSYHAGNASPAMLAFMRGQVGEEFAPLNRGSTLPEITMPACMQAAAASSHVWISCANTSARESCWPAFFVRADGVITGRLRRNVAGVLVSTVDTKEELYDSTRDWRGRAMRGVFHTGKLVRDPRSQRRTEL